MYDNILCYLGSGGYCWDKEKIFILFYIYARTRVTVWIIDLIIVVVDDVDDVDDGNDD